MAGQQGPMPPIPPQQNQQAGMIYDAPNCDYDPPSYMDQNFGNPYDCPEGNFLSAISLRRTSKDLNFLPSFLLLSDKILTKAPNPFQIQISC